MSTIQINNVKTETEDYKEKKDRSLTFLTLAVLSLFIGFGLVIGFYNYTLISFYALSKFLIGFAIVGFIIPLKYYQKWFHFIKYEMIIFNVIGISPTLTALFLVINFVFATNTTTKTYKIEKIYFDKENFIGVILEDNAFSGEQKIIEFSNTNPNKIVNKQYLKLIIANGCFGFDVIKERELIFTP